MTVQSLTDFRVLTVPGLYGSGPGHWQSRWEQLYPVFERVEQDQWDRPELQLWAQRLADVLSASARPTLILAHSFGCLATVHCATQLPGWQASPIAGALLVAPADPVKFGVQNEVQASLPFPSIVIGSSNDPWMKAADAATWATSWGSTLVDGGALGHINTESALGDWPAGLAILGQLEQQVSAARYRRALL